MPHCCCDRKLVYGEWLHLALTARKPEVATSLRATGLSVTRSVAQRTHSSQVSLYSTTASSQATQLTTCASGFQKASSPAVRGGGAGACSATQRVGAMLLRPLHVRPAAPAIGR